MKRFTQLSIFALLLVATSFAQSAPVNLETGTDPKPHLTNAKLQSIDASSGLKPVVDRLYQRASPLWIAYQIPTLRKERTMCCFDNWNGMSKSGCCLGCRLENRESGFNMGRVEGSDCRLEPSDYAFVFLRAEGGHLTKYAPSPATAHWTPPALRSIG